VRNSAVGLVQSGVTAVDHLGFWKNSGRISAAAAVGTVLTTALAATFAWWIGRRQQRLFDLQREIAGLAVVRDARRAFMEDRIILSARESIAEAMATKRPVPAVEGGADLLNVLEEVGLYVERKFISAEVVSELLAHWVIGYWYACEEFIRTSRDEVRDPEVWRQVEKLVEKLHKVSANQKVLEWSRRPSQEVLQRFFAHELRHVGARLRPEPTPSN